MSDPLYFVIVNYHSTELIVRLLQSIETVAIADASNYCVIVVNNSPEDASIHHLASECFIVLESGANVGFGRACNLGIDWVYARHPEAIIWLLNPDTRLTTGALAQARNLLSNHSNLSILGTVVREPDGKVWFGGGEFVPETGQIVALETLPEALQPDSQTAYLPAKWVTGCSLLLNLRCFPSAPHFDPDYFLYYEDFDFCLRYARQGHTIGLTGKISPIHYPSSIAGRNAHLRLQHSLYSYLLALEKHASQQVLLTRLARMTVSAAIALPVRPQHSFSKLKGLSHYCNRVLKQWLARF